VYGPLSLTIAIRCDPVPSGGTPASFCQRTALVEPQPDALRGELDVSADEALRHLQAAVKVEPLARGHVRYSQQQHDLADLAGGRAGVLLL
jgi:hypothetical protein